MKASASATSMTRAMRSNAWSITGYPPSTTCRRPSIAATRTPDEPYAGGRHWGNVLRAISQSVESGATISARSLSPFGERVGVRGLQTYRETLTPHPTPLPMGEGADRACRSPSFHSREMHSKVRPKTRQQTGRIDDAANARFDDRHAGLRDDVGH